MTHHRRFLEAVPQAPPQVQDRAYKAYRQWRANPFARSLRFRRVSETDSVYSVRIGRQYRALGVLEDDTVYWHFIGNHDDYELELKKL
ncbi:MAG: hypothetical protein HY318_11275 [Armatimonadetes bacterium]|nr:hypothetical protein [Armatimonadota bacterium]